MSRDDTITVARRKTGGFASRLLHKAMSERNRANPVESHRIRTESIVSEVENNQENKLTQDVSPVSD